MPDRVRHALRFALTTLAAVYAVGVGWELTDVYVLSDAAGGLGAAETVRFNEFVWRWIAAALATTVFLFRLGDLNAALPTWGFAWLVALWLAAASVATGTAIERHRFGLAAAIAAAAIVVWLLLHRRIPGWPGAQPPAGAPPRAPSPERDLQRLR